MFYGNPSSIIEFLDYYFLHTQNKQTNNKTKPKQTNKQEAERGSRDDLSNTISR